MTEKRPQIATNPATGQPYTVEEALAQNKQVAGGTIAIDWQKHHVLAPRSDVVEMLTYLQTKDAGERQAMRYSVEQSLKKFDKRLERRRYLSPDDHQHFCEDMAIWFALEVADGRGSIEEH